MVPNKRDAVAIGLQHGFARYGVEFNIIAWVYPGTRARAGARVFGAHCFNGHCVPLIHRLPFLPRSGPLIE
jgi:hypothetical protein